MLWKVQRKAKNCRAYVRSLEYCGLRSRNLPVYMVERTLLEVCGYKLQSELLSKSVLYLLLYLTITYGHANNKLACNNALITVVW